MSVAKFKQIPEGYIEDAEEYRIIPMDTELAVDLGGRIMLKLVVLDQMEIDNIVLTTGLTNKVCLIVVAYTDKQVREMIGNARRLAGKMADDLSKN